MKLRNVLGGTSTTELRHAIPDPASSRKNVSTTPRERNFRVHWPNHDDRVY
jgi:hypothetical protein